MRCVPVWLAALAACGAEPDESGADRSRDSDAVSVDTDAGQHTDRTVHTDTGEDDSDHTDIAVEPDSGSATDSDAAGDRDSGAAHSDSDAPLDSDSGAATDSDASGDSDSGVGAHSDSDAPSDSDSDVGADSDAVVDSDSAADTDGGTGPGDAPALCAVQLTPPPGAVVNAHVDQFGTTESVAGTWRTVGPTPSQVHLGLPDRDPSTAAAFLWRTDRATLATQVELTDATATYPFSGSSFAYGGASGQDHRVHEVRLCGLRPGTTYHYRVGGDGHWSPSYAFTTPAAPGSFDTFTFGVLGDSRGSPTTLASAIDALFQHDPDLVLFTGDMIDQGASETEWWDWWDAAGDRFATTWLLPVHGNHEDLAAAWFAQWSLPGNEQWYDVVWGDATFAILQDTVLDPTTLSVTERDFLEASLCAAPGRWRFTAHHRPMYAITQGHGSALDVRAAWAASLDRCHVDVDWSGHNHAYERSVPILADTNDPAGTVHVVSGGAGAPLYAGSTTGWFHVTRTVSHHVVVARVTAQGLSVEARDLTGTVLDQFERAR